MTKNHLLPFILIFAIVLTSCKSEKKQEGTPEVKPTLTLTKENTTVSFTAYKTTDKVPVKGFFSESNAVLPENASTPEEALNGLKFEIPVSSLYTNDTIRDGKLKKSFFGSMVNTSILSGTISLTDSSNGTVALNMNGMTADLPITIAINENTATINGVIDLKNWNALQALTALNEVCFDLHKGPDGVSKTWEDVAIEVVTTFE